MDALKLLHRLRHEESADPVRLLRDALDLLVALKDAERAESFGATLRRALRQ